MTHSSPLVSSVTPLWAVLASCNAAVPTLHPPPARSPPAPPPLPVLQMTLSTASDLKGSIPQYAVNFVAKRTPIKWTDRLKRMVTERYMGAPPIDTKVRIRDWHPT